LKILCVDTKQDDRIKLAGFGAVECAQGYSARAIDPAREDIERHISAQCRGPHYQLRTTSTPNGYFEQSPAMARSAGEKSGSAASHERLQLADSVEKVGSAAAGRSGVPAVEVAGSHFKLPLGTSLSVLAQV